MRARLTRGPRALAAALLTAVVLGSPVVSAPATGAPSGPATAPGTSIDHVEADGEELRLLLSLSDLPSGVGPDLDAVEVAFDGTPLDAVAEPLDEAATGVRRTAVLAVDVSDSMRGPKFAAAKAAADAFLADVPDDVRVGLVTFAGQVRVAQQPTSDVTEVAAAVDRLRLSRGTRLYDGLGRAVDVAGAQGARSVLVLSDGRDTSEAPVGRTARIVERAGVKVDVVALAQTAADEALLGRLADAGNGSVLRADDPGALTRLFADEAAVLADQVLVTVAPPAELAGDEGTLTVTVPVDGRLLTDEAFVTVPARAGAQQEAEAPSPATAPGPAAAAVRQVPHGAMLGGLAAAGLAVAVMVVVAFSGSRRPREDAIDRGIEAYTRAGARKRAEADHEAELTSPGSMTKVVAVAESMLEGREGFEAGLADRLDAAGSALKPAEWLLAHAGTAVLTALVALLLSGGRLVVALVALLLGAVGPWVWLSVRRTRRLRAFSSGLADTLQLMAGSLSAGLSLAQSIDTVVKEGSDPIASEFRRALVETRLGIEIEDSLAGVAERMDSVDFEWVVMAIRIQRDVGGNLSELLTKVAETIREREFLVRQVTTLSAEGRLSVWILAGLPPVFTVYLALTNPEYLAPMFATVLGFVLLGVMVVLLGVGIIWMKKVAKVDV
ncbi:MAG: Flp pilus assembly protein TadB [uncultured Nocardioidaceae bacterium]|uniref:Flp pilus assembly protein TadB n=1 Tax=uncultured Nocardioidaceae bacterium TaxID=253824 RepID=A0A6J4MNV0_9ACTN|nr:MAG: Flp pilus assembly protein TadB [uncultured Nocardioidaceae bacterium]